ncbi:MAG: DUF4097 family beta strand repeat protein [Elusimicrobia bacterium]|nr:DUF4097 family beta strand repeat protein [Elusimicrobiota bacterium]
MRQNSTRPQKSKLIAAAAAFLAVSPLDRVQGASLYREFALAPDSEVEVETVAGNVVIGATTTERALISLEAPGEMPGGCKLETAFEAGRLIVKLQGKQVSRRWGFWHVNTEACSEVTMRLLLPKSAPVTVATASGDVRLAERDAAAKITTSSGDIEIENIQKSLEASSCSGDIEGKQLRAPAKLSSVSGGVKLSGLTRALAAQTSSGDIELAWDTAPSQGKIEAAASSGDVKLYFPQGTKINAKLSGRFGSQPVNELGSDPQAPLTVEAQNISGTLGIYTRR